MSLVEANTSPMISPDLPFNWHSSSFFTFVLLLPLDKPGK